MATGYPGRARERDRLDTDTVTEQRQVGEEVRGEQAEGEGDQDQLRRQDQGYIDQSGGAGAAGEPAAPVFSLQAAHGLRRHDR